MAAGVAGEAAAASLVGMAAAGAGALASQMVGVAFGMQDSISWKGVAAGALTGAVSGGLGIMAAGGGSNAIASTTPTVMSGNTVAALMLNNAAAQGINMALGQQKQFSWTQLAMAGVTAWAGQKADWVKELQADRFGSAAFQTGSAMAGWGIDHAQGRDNGSGSSALISAISSAVASAVASSMQSVDNAKQQGVTATAQKAEVVDLSGAAPLLAGGSIESTGGFEIDGAAFARDYYAGKQVNIGPSAGPSGTSANNYIVQKGDTLWGIENDLGLPHGSLAARNGVGNHLKLGQSLATDVEGMSAQRMSRALFEPMRF